jgi:DNA modification methylase
MPDPVLSRSSEIEEDSPTKRMLTGAICPECKLHRGHRASCSKAFKPPETTPKDLSIKAYRDFLKRKVILSEDRGFAIGLDEIHPWLKMHQRLAVQWMVRGGRRALFASFGLGKSVMQLEAVRLTLAKTGGSGLIVAPLGVRREFLNDATRIGVDLKFIQSTDEISGRGIYLTNYESVRDEKLDPSKFAVASLDEAAILKSFGGTKTFRNFMRLFDAVNFRFVATAVPDPNEYIELLAYAAYLGIAEVSQMKTRFFKRDSTKADHLTLHPHKEREYFLWLSSWALFIGKPSDLGPECSDEGYDLPPLEIVYHEVKVDHAGAVPERSGQGRLYREAMHGVVDAAREKRDTLTERIAKARDILEAEPGEHFILWHDLEAERNEIERTIPAVVAVYGAQRGSQTESEKLEQTLGDFAEGRLQYIAIKPSMFGCGGNYQYHCARAIFCGVGFKFSEFIQACHRIVRFLQMRPVRLHVIYAESEKRILDTLLEKWERYKAQSARMSEIIREYGLSDLALRKALTRSLGVKRTEAQGTSYSFVNNDCVEELERLAPDSVGLILTSPPYSQMYEYSQCYEDFGHSDTNEHFFEQMDFLTPRLLRVLKPGRIAAFHVKDRIVPGGVNGLGFQTVYSFHTDCIQHFQKHGFAYIGMKTIVTDVVRENKQTHRLGWTEQCKDGSKMGVGMPEYLLLFRKPPTDSTNAYADEPVVKTKPLSIAEDGTIVPFSRNRPMVPESGYSRSRWQIDAHGYMRSSGNRLLTAEDLRGLKHDAIFKLFRKFSLTEVYDFEEHVRWGEALESQGILPVTFMLLQPQSWHPDVWSDITRMRTLNSTQSSHGRQMHLCAMQLDLVNRVIAQMSMPGETVLDPFAGIGTVPQCAVLLNRKAIGIELAHDYYTDGAMYCQMAEQKRANPTLFDLLEAEEDVLSANEQISQRVETVEESAKEA